MSTSYDKTVWATGDFITAARMNNIEDALEKVDIEINDAIGENGSLASLEDIIIMQDTIGSTLAETFDNSNSYTSGDYVIYSPTNGVNHLYKFTQNHTGNWTGNDVIQTSVSNELEIIKSDMSYVPIKITSFSVNPSTMELGSSGNVTLSVAFSKTPATVTLDGVTKTIPYNGETVSVSDNQTHIKTWTLTAADSGSASNSPVPQTAQASVRWLPKIYYGAAAIPQSINSTFIVGLSDSALAASKSKTFTVNATSGEYIWFASPVNYGACSFKVGGFDGGFEAAQTVSVTNASGYIQNYYIYRSTNASLGSTTVAVS